MNTGTLYDWLKVGHIVSMVAWMAAMFYLPRLFVYHADSPKGSMQGDTFKIMERRLLKAIMTPAMIATWIFGLALAVMGGWYTSGWLHAKLLLVVGLSGLHGLLAATVRQFANGENTRTSRYFRVINEVPTLALLLIVALVVIKPF